MLIRISEMTESTVNRVSEEPPNGKELRPEDGASEILQSFIA